MDTRKVKAVAPSVLTPDAPRSTGRLWHAHDTFSDSCWCKPKRDVQEPSLIIHNDVPYPHH